MSRSYTMGEQLDYEKINNQRVLESLLKEMKSRGMMIKEVVDVTNNPDWYDKDIDFLINGEGWEFKNDRYETGNCFLETISNAKTGALGWLFMSQAEWLVYAYPAQNVAFIAKFSTLRQWFLDNAYSLKVNQRLRSVWTDDGTYRYKAYGYLAKLADLEKDKVFVKFTLIED